MSIQNYENVSRLSYFRKRQTTDKHCGASARIAYQQRLKRLGVLGSLLVCLVINK